MEVLQQILQQLINGISLGSIYALIALGYTMIYGIIKLINFAHGDIYMVGAYLGFYAITLGIPVVPAILISMAVTSLLGVVVERLAYRPLRHAPRISVLITAIGVSFLLEYVMMAIVSPTPRTFPATLSDVSFNLGGLIISGQQMLIMGVTLLLMLILTYIVLGIVEAFISGLGFSMFRDAAAFAILILVLLIRPAGIFGKNVKEKV